jgi:dUTPase
MRIVQVPDTELMEVEELDMTKNRGGGYGSSGK